MLKRLPSNPLTVIWSFHLGTWSSSSTFWTSLISSKLSTNGSEISTDAVSDPVWVAITVSLWGASGYSGVDYWRRKREWFQFRTWSNYLVLILSYGGKSNWLQHWMEWKGSQKKFYDPYCPFGCFFSSSDAYVLRYYKKLVFHVLVLQQPMCFECFWRGRPHKQTDKLLKYTW